MVDDALAPPRLTRIDEAVAAARSIAPSVGRALLGIAGAPGAGKSTLAEALAAALSPAAVVVPMDGFHLPNAVLRERGLDSVKGAPSTFDRAGFVALLRRLRTADVVRAPSFDRAREEVIPDAILVPPSARLVVVEGNYLLHWPDVRALLDEVWFVEASSEVERVERLVTRHVHFGRTPEQARAWVQRSDQANARLVIVGRGSADRVVSVW